MAAITQPPQYVKPTSFSPSTPPASIRLSVGESCTRTGPLSMIWAFPIAPSSPTSPSPSPSSHLPTPLLRSSLASVLDDFPILCASLTEDAKGLVTAHLDNANPVALLDATSPLHLSDCIPPPSTRYSPPPPRSPPQSYFHHPHTLDCALLPPNLTVPCPLSFNGPSLHLQLTRFACGGLIIGLSGFHCLMDATAVGTFITEWGRRTQALSAGGSTDPPHPGLRVRHPPTFDRSFLSDGIEAAFCAHPIADGLIQPIDATPDDTSTPPARFPMAGPGAAHVVPRVYYFPRVELEAMRAAAAAPLPPLSVSVHDALFAHLMQVVCEATGTVGDESVLVCQAMGGRRALGQPHFFGCPSFWLHHRSTFASILASLHRTALAVHHTHASPSRAELLAGEGYLATFPTYADVRIVPRLTTHDLHVASWRHSGMLDADFGQGPATFAGPNVYGAARYMIFMDTARDCEEGVGGVDVYLALEDEHFKRMLEQGMMHRFATSL